MKKLETFVREKLALNQCLQFVLAVMTLLVTGCPHNDYTVQLKPQGNVIERTLTFYCIDTDNADTNNVTTNYQTFDAAALAAITALYPTNSLTNDGTRYVVRGEFTNAMPADVGGAGIYTNLANSLGEAGFYVERFRGNDDLAGMVEQRFKAAGQLTDLIIGWSQTELGREPGYDKLHHFLDVDFRRDLKNVSSYWTAAVLANGYKTNSSEEFAIRFGQYLFERGYFTLDEIPGLTKIMDDPQPLLRQMQRLVARKMGVPDSEPVPASLAFLADDALLEKSFTNYLAGTDAYRAKLKQWAEDLKLKPDTKRPEPSDVAGDAFGNLIDFDLLGDTSDHLAVQLLLAAPPLHTNGRWDDVLKQVVWQSDIMSRTNMTQLPFTCYANWAQADEEFQKAHLGKVALTGDDLSEYCLWRSGQDAQHGGEWDAFLASLKPGDGLMEKLDAFRFTGEPSQVETNNQQNIPIPSAYPRELLKNALQ
jgi:hypothetical protein